MSKKDSAKLLEVAKQQLKDKNIVAFIGESYCGKTVVSALLKFTLSNYFVPKSNGEFEAEVTKGNNIISSIIKRMMHHGFFPPHTLPYHKSPIMIDIYNTSGFGGKIELILRDMSGEDYEDYLTTEYENADDRISDLLSEGKADGESYSPLSHLIFSKIYVILVDCSKYNEWITEQSNYALMIRVLKQLKEKAEEISDGKFTAPIAIVFTKADLLPEEKKNVKASELINVMPELVSALHINHKGLIEYFLVSVNTEKATPEDIAQMRVLEQDDKKFTEETIQERLKRVFETAKKNAIQSGLDEQQSILKANEIKKAELEKIEAEKKQFENLPNQIFKLKKPITYSNSEYIRFISWIIERLLSK